MNIFSFKYRESSNFEQLLEPYFDQLYRLAFRFTTNQDEAEDLLQELLTKLYPKQDQLQQIEDLKPWLARSLYNLFIDRYRSSTRSAIDLIDRDSSEKLDNLRDHAENPEELNARWQIQDLLSKAMFKLSEPHRILLILHDIEGYSLPELTDVLNLPLGTLKSRLHRARDGLRIILTREPFSSIGRVSSERQQK
ncbi:MAG: RNA polymerase sigma factor [Candidatus Thiodiazotropha sp. (ex Codakia rugifera)]|nr:RNA polymerase sigma factor [Candidatus Thiodiazotropha sp. (ex Codakia rugifera)]